MKKLLIMRHGQSQVNAEHIYGGSMPLIPLTQLGREQAKLAGEDLIGHEIDLMYASPFVRAQDTAKIVADVIGYPASRIITDDRLHEINIGTLTGEPDEGFVKGYQHIASGDDHTAETPAEITGRLTAFLHDLVPQAADMVVLIVAHAGVCRTFEAILTGATLESLAHTTIPNAEPFELPLDLIKEFAK